MTELYVKVETGQKMFNIETGPMLKVDLTEEPENGRANAELVRELSKILGNKIAIIKGQQKPRKKIKVNLSKKEVDEKVKEWEKQR